MKRSSLAEATIWLSWLKLRVLTGQLTHTDNSRAVIITASNNRPVLSLETHSSLENVWRQTSSDTSHRLVRASALPVAKYLAGVENTTRTCLGTGPEGRSGNSLSLWVKLNADTIGRMGVDAVELLQLGPTAENGKLFTYKLHLSPVWLYSNIFSISLRQPPP